MCGISGIFQFDTTADKGRFVLFNRALSHRGPDHQAEYFSSSGQVGLGHCRLSIVDTTEAANQPFLSEDRRFSLTFNGEIYNYIEVKSELQALGYRFRSQSDTEVLLVAFQVWGKACLDRLNGMFAFAVWDEKTQELFLARDRFGVKSLYFRHDNFHIAFASEQKAFLKHPQGLQICAEKASYLMTFPEAVEAERGCLYQGLEKLLPGEHMTVTKHGIRIERWWNTYQHLMATSERDVDADELIALFEDACEVRTRTDVKIATSLSGGLDSSAVTSMLATLDGIKELKQLKSFIGSFENTEMDEYPWAQKVVEHHGLMYKRVCINIDDALTYVTQSCLAAEDVNDLPAIGQWMIYGAMNKEGYKVSIEGHGGDELLAGYHRHLNVYLGDVLRQKNDILELAMVINSLGTIRPTAGSTFLKGNILNAPLEPAALHNRLTSKKMYLTALLSGSSDFAPDLVKERELTEYQRETMLFQKLYEDFHYYTLPYILKNYDRISMANSVEVRSPFLDYRFVLAAFRAKTELKIHQGRTKCLIREHFSFIPEAVRNREDKSGFTPPMKSWLEKRLAGWMLRLVSEDRIRNSSLFDGKQLSQILNRLAKNNKMDKVLLYWPLINLALLDSK